MPARHPLTDGSSAQSAEAAAAARVRDALDEVSSLDHDRIIRAFLGVILASCARTSTRPVTATPSTSRTSR
jgi:glutamate dehydrogenase